MEGRYPPGVLIILNDCTKRSEESNFNKWYEKKFTPGIEGLGFISNTRRYVNVLGGKPTFQGHPKYLALSEVYRDDLDQALKDFWEYVEELKARQEYFDAMVTKVETMYKRIGPEFRSNRSGQPVKTIYCGLLSCIDPAREEEFNNWYNAKHSPETLETGAFDTGYRYKVLDPYHPMPHQSSAYLSIYESSMNPSMVQSEIMKGREKMLSDRIWVELLGVHFAALFRPV